MSKCIKSLIQNMNIVIGCSIGCDYCYARNNVRRFHMTEDFNKPVYFERKLRLIDNKKPHNWLMTGMSDFSDWAEVWKEQVFERIEANPQHNYIFITKRPERCRFSTDLDNVWMGVTVTSSKEKERISDLKKHIKAKHYHVSFEPMFDDVGDLDLDGIDWIVAGTMTGAKSRKFYSRPQWIMNITDQAHKLNIPLFMKEDLIPLMGEENMIQELPENFYKVLREQER